MLRELKFVQGSVAKTSLVPELTHFAIENGTVRGYNGTLALCSPIQFDITCRPKADLLIKAIANCEETAQLTMTKAGRLSVKSGKFKAFIDCLPDENGPHVQPEGERVAVDGASMLQALKTIAPFIGDSPAPSRAWANGALLLGKSVFATNNVILVEYWTGVNIAKPINIPRAAIKELLRINEPPEAMQFADNSVTFHFGSRRWLRTQLLETQWPDLLKILNKESNPQPLDNRLFEALKTIKPFADKLNQVIFRGSGKIATHIDENEGAEFDIDGFNHTGSYNIELLNLLNGVVKTIDWSMYPAPCLFFGERLRGAIIGMKK